MLLQGLLNPKHKSRGHRPLIPDTQNPSPLLKTVTVWDASIGQESSLPKKHFLRAQKWRHCQWTWRADCYLQMDQLSLTNIQVPGYWKIRDGFKGIYNGMYLKSKARTTKKSQHVTSWTWKQLGNSMIHQTTESIMEFTIESWLNMPQNLPRHWAFQPLGTAWWTTPSD